MDNKLDDLEVKLNRVTNGDIGALNFVIICSVIAVIICSLPLCRSKNGYTPQTSFANYKLTAKVAIYRTLDPSTRRRHKRMHISYIIIPEYGHIDYFGLLWRIWTFMYEVKSRTVHRNNIGHQSLNKVSSYHNNVDIQFQIPVLS
jgi:hypothetical protein